MSYSFQKVHSYLINSLQIREKMFTETRIQSAFPGDQADSLDEGWQNSITQIVWSYYLKTDDLLVKAVPWEIELWQ